MPEFATKPRRLLLSCLVLGPIAVTAVAYWLSAQESSRPAPEPPKLGYKPRQTLDTSGYTLFLGSLPDWGPKASLEEIGDIWSRGVAKEFASVDRALISGRLPTIAGLALKAKLYNADGDPQSAYQTLKDFRLRVEADDALAVEHLYTVIYYQGVTGLRLGENENCILCRGESSCILPVSPAAVHTNPAGSRLAVEHFGEYLRQFPDDLEVRWLLNLAHMTLGEHPHAVDPAFLITLDRFAKSEFDIGKFRDIGALVGLNRLNQSGGAIMEDFDNDGLLDVVVTSWDPAQPMALFRNKGDGTFEDRTKAAGLSGQLGGLYCVQADYNNDGHMDIFICRGAWVQHPMRPSLLRNNGDGTFTDVTEKAGVMAPVNSICAAWADYDNDGLLDLFVCCENQPNLLYRNKGDGTFEEVALAAGVQGKGEVCKGAAWIDFEGDGYPDLFVNNLGGFARLYRNNRDGTFRDVTREMGIDGPINGFSCWAFDYDNDGWPDIFATSYAHDLASVVQGVLGRPHGQPTGRLYRNLKGKGFEDVTKAAGLDGAYATMGSNFADFDNDGFLDIYLATGDPSLDTLVPNRMFKNVAGKRFAEITGSSRTGHLQKGHGVACGDWARDGHVDLFVEMGGATKGDKYHNVLFRNPGQGNNWLTVKLVGKKTNRAAIGARIKVVTDADKPLTVYRHVSSGSSFGANPLQQTIGLAKARRVATLEVYWPTSRTTQVFHDVAVDRAIEITEFAKEYRELGWKPIPVPK
jgi:hypothetical protein